jgi:flagellar basal body-associated protein FliL
MLSLTIVVLAAAAAGFIVWANDKRHAKYGAGVPAGLAVAVAALAWTILMAAGFGYRPGVTWIPWVLPIVLGSAAAVAAAIYLGRTRARQDMERLTAILRA